MISSRSTERDSLLFVYGTLRPFVDTPMARWLRRVARHVGPGMTRGALYDLGSYPCLRTGARRLQWVVGDVYRVAGPGTLHVLDRYEAQFVRERCIVQLARGGRRRAWIYRYRFPVGGLSRIVSGDYRAHRQRTP
jgi:gamma-glutamylcyclotransferase (GGCT)/AIG2-like uncharacterized protein YtfP